MHPFKFNSSSALQESDFESGTSGPRCWGKLERLVWDPKSCWMLLRKLAQNKMLKNCWFKGWNFEKKNICNKTSFQKNNTKRSGGFCLAPSPLWRFLRRCWIVPPSSILLNKETVHCHMFDHASAMFEHFQVADHFFLGQVSSTGTWKRRMWFCLRVSRLITTNNPSGFQHLLWNNSNNSFFHLCSCPLFEYCHL